MEPDVAQVVEDSSLPDSPQKPQAWGFWETLGLTFIIVLAQLVIDLVVGAVFAAVYMARSPNLSTADVAILLSSNGLYVSVATAVTAPAIAGLCVMFAWLRRGMPVRDYFGLTKPSLRVFLFWVGLAAAFAPASDTLRYAIGQNTLSRFTIDAYQSAVFVPLLWVAFIVMAPMWEEIVFRGFLFTGIQQSRVGSAGAVLVTATLWAGLHLQYNLCGILTVLVLGLLLGMARLQSGSIVPCIVMHGVNNLIATVEVAVYVYLNR